MVGLLLDEPAASGQHTRHAGAPPRLAASPVDAPVLAGVVVEQVAAVEQLRLQATT